MMIKHQNGTNQVLPKFTRFTRSISISISYSILCTALSVMFAAFAIPGTAAAASFSDLSGHWAEEDITELVEQNVIKGYPDGTFRPDSALTRGELASLLVSAFDLGKSEDTPAQKAEPVFPDLNGHWSRPFVSVLSKLDAVKGYPDGKFHPDSKVTRAEATSTVIRVIGLADVSPDATPDSARSQTYSDVTPDHWAFEPIETAAQLSVLPPSFTGKFSPDRNITRAEIAYILNRARSMKLEKGIVSSVDSASNSIRIASGEDSKIFTLPPDATIYRNNLRTTLDNLRNGDQVYIVLNASGDPAVIKSYGIVTKDDVFTKVSQISGNLLEPDQLEAIMAGDWESVSWDLQKRLYSELIKLGLSPEQAQSILYRDWNALNEVSKNELSRALGNVANLPPELVTALINRDFESLKTYTQMELTRRILQEMAI